MCVCVYILYSRWRKMGFLTALLLVNVMRQNTSTLNGLEIGIKKKSPLLQEKIVICNSLGHFYSFG